MFIVEQIPVYTKVQTCYRCFERSILELWNFDEKTVANLTDQEIVHAVNDVHYR